MFHSEEIIQKDVQTPNGCGEFQLRWMADEGVGVLTDRDENHFFLLDSGDSWYDLTQDRHPPKQKCRCKNDWFTLTLDYLPRWAPRISGRSRPGSAAPPAAKKSG